ncbi:MAG: peptidoglycan DD-metalloendopeptidase family protein [Patescibacteria group bacterium]
MSRILKISIFLLFVLCFKFSFSLVYAQTDEEKMADLKVQIQALEQRAQQLKGTISQTQEQANTLKNQIINLKNQMASLQTQISLTGKKIDKTKIEINNVQNNIFDTQEKIGKQKNTIGQLLLFMARRDKDNLLSIILKNNDLSDYFRQTQSAMAVNTNLINLVDDLQNTEDQLSQNKNNLEEKKSDLESLKQQQNAQKVSLGQATKDKDQLLKDTKGQEAQYQKMLAEVERQESVFFSQLRELETRVIQGGLYIVHVTASALPKKGTKLFKWPEEGYRITQGYGCTKYARCGRKSGPYNGAPHNGIDMAAGYGSPIYAIANGQIIANGKNDGWGNWVAIQHPNQYNLVSIYSHMSALSFLQVGTGVYAGQIVGYEGNTGNVTGSHLHLSIYEDFFTYINEKKDQLYFNYFEGSVNPFDYLQ